MSLTTLPADILSNFARPSLSTFARPRTGGRQFSAFYCTFTARSSSRKALFSGVLRFSDIVGYAQNGIQNGGTVVSPQFVNIGSTNTLPLESLIPTGENLSDNVFIQQLDAFGRTVVEYGWVDWAGDSGDQEAWIDTDTFEIAEDVSFAPGQGLWVMGSTSSQGIQSAGKVGTSDVSVTLCNGGITTGNPFPVSLDLQDIIPEGESLSDNVFIQQLDAFGRTVVEYGWVDWAGDSGDQEAWIDTDTFEIAEDVSFAPGQGLWVMGSSTEQSVRFPAPEL